MFMQSFIQIDAPVKEGRWYKLTYGYAYATIIIVRKDFIYMAPNPATVASRRTYNIR